MSTKDSYKTAFMRTPERNETFELFASEIIDKLDDNFDKEEVYKIAQWVLYLSTQD